ncbi:expressed unknown protein [Seminavis robusta]|uniref:Uncharacterized protein n=1 Tax=Seminavis robusta TaxID=568900 RepID=A0A9N8HE79_9STRA|nr:expressed unknown protein [Seminavis robusta]|eukprot:Sro392_g133360.1 n/a (293) ;mRNA; f:28566-29444
MSGRTTQAESRGRSTSPSERKLNRRANTRRSGSVSRLADLLREDAEPTATRTGRGRSREQETGRSRSRSQSVTRILGRLQIEASINQEHIEKNEEPQLSSKKNNRRARRNVSSTQPEKNPLRRTLSKEMDRRRSVRQMAIIEIQARERNQEAIFEKALSRQRGQTKPDTKKPCSLSPTTDLARRSKRKTKGSKPVCSVGSEKSVTRLRTSLAIRKLGEMSDSLHGSWAESSMVLSCSGSEGSSNSILEQAQRMKSLSERFHDSNKKLQKKGLDPTVAPPKRLSKDIPMLQFQ